MTTYDSFYLLAADIGASKTAMALFEGDKWPSAPLCQRTFQNREAESFPHLVEQFLQQADKPVHYAGIGIAGPVLGDPVQMTNLDWTVSGQKLKQQFGFKKIFLLNDLVATAMGATGLNPEDILTLNHGTHIPGATIAVLAPGTGLGEAFVIRENDTPFPHPSEGAHASFAPRTPLQMELLKFMLQTKDHVSVEQVCAGSSLPALFHFMTTLHPLSATLKNRLNKEQDTTPIIVAAALESLANKNEQCVAFQTIQLFCDILADEAANLTLKTMSLGGLLLGGGLSPRLRPFLKSPRFMSIFTRGVYRDWLADIPVHIILKPDIALTGAAAYGFNKLK